MTRVKSTDLSRYLDTCAPESSRCANFQSISTDGFFRAKWRILADVRQSEWVNLFFALFISTQCSLSDLPYAIFIFEGLIVASSSWPGTTYLPTRKLWYNQRQAGNPTLKNKGVVYHGTRLSSIFASAGACIPFAHLRFRQLRSHPSNSFRVFRVTHW